PELPDAQPEAVQRQTTFSLGRKVSLALSGFVVITALCGFVGLLFFNRIEASVSILSTVATPLLIESMALQNNADRMRSVLSDNPEDDSTRTERLIKIAKLDEEGRLHTKNLEHLANNLGLQNQFEEIEQLQRNFTSTLQDMVQAQVNRANASHDIADLY